MSVHSITLRLLLMEERRSSRGGYSHLLLVGVEVGLLAVLGGGVELRPQVLELLHQAWPQRVKKGNRPDPRKVLKQFIA